MRITSFFVKNYQFTLVVVLMIVVVSAVTLFTMPRAEDPDIHAPQFPIVVLYPGTSPKDMEELVVKPIEKRVSELENLKKITSRIDDGVAVINVEYKYESNSEDKYQELVREINANRAALRQAIYRIEVRKIAASDVNFIQIAPNSENECNERMKFYAEELKEDLEKVKSLKKVEYWGVPDQ